MNGFPRKWAKWRKFVPFFLLLFLPAILFSQDFPTLVFELVGRVPASHLLNYSKLVGQASWKDTKLEGALRQALLTYQGDGNLQQLTQTTRNLLAPSSGFFKLRLGEDMAWLQRPVEVTLDSQPVGYLGPTGLVIQHVDPGTHALSFDSPVTQLYTTNILLPQPYAIIELPVFLSRAKRSVTLNTIPQGANVWIDGEKQGETTPIKVSLEVGFSYTFTFEAVGYNRNENTLNFPEKGKTLVQTVILERNFPPDAPQKIGPETSVRELTATLEWTATDPEGETLVFDVLLELEGTWNTLARDIPQNQFPLDELAYNKQYHWKIVAKDGHGNETTSDSWLLETPKGRYPEKMVLAQSGSFSMGAREADLFADDDEKPTFQVHLTYDFLVGQFEITQQEFQEFSGQTSIPGNEQLPAASVSWWDAIAFCNWRSEQEGLAKAYDSLGNFLDGSGNVTRDVSRVEGYRLLTEAEWEYVARGAHALDGEWTFAGGDDLDSLGWFESNSNGKVQPVGKKAPNSLDLYDLCGNTWEWCNDWYAPEAYAKGNQTNPTGPTSGSLRVLRGGGWYDAAQFCRVSNRFSAPPEETLENIGFRLARSF
ncbi:MAG TPA: SUMF1/EgtB/PvdO family nonheme iron enzyme [Thermotogota bacterium]|nr:SUMF1/EgtB/PvdO family nonheme iron enzyme [Thermotogota bacterium]